MTIKFNKAELNLLNATLQQDIKRMQNMLNDKGKQIDKLTSSFGNVKSANTKMESTLQLRVQQLEDFKKKAVDNISGIDTKLRNAEERAANYKISLDTSANRVTEQKELIQEFRDIVAEKNHEIEKLGKVATLQGTQLTTAKGEYAQSEHDIRQLTNKYDAMAMARNNMEDSLHLEQRKSSTLMEVIVALHEH